MTVPSTPTYTPTDKVRKLRQEKFMTIEELSEVSGVHYHTILRAEQGKKVKVATVKKLAKALDVAPNDIAYLS